VAEISQIENVITTTFRARGGQAIAEMGGVAQGFGRVGTVINENTRMSERLNSQWRALGTTIRYAIAGTAVFGLTRLVGQLKAVQQQLGLMQAVGEPVGGGVFSDAQITNLGSRLRKSAVDALTPVQEINDAVINFLSTVQGVQQSEVPEIVTNIGQAAKLAQTPVEDLTKAATTMNIAFGRANNFKNIAEFNRQWFALIKTAPGGIAAAPQIAQQIPALATMFMLAPGQNISSRRSQAQLMSLTLGAVRTGAPPSVAMRGLTYLLQSIAQPTGKAGTALAQIGITPQTVQKQGVYANLMKLLRTITNTGNINLISRIPEDQLDDSSNLPGIPAAQMVRLRQMIPRIHGIRAAIILAHQLKPRGTVQSLQQDLEMMVNEQNNQVDDAHNMAIAWENFRKRAKLQEASIAINSMGLQVAQMFEPVMNFVAKGPIGLQGLMQRHQTISKDVGYGVTGAFLAAMAGRAIGLGRIPAISRIPMLGRMLGGAGGGVGNAFVSARAVESAISGNTQMGATPQNPIYVVVVGQLFGGYGGAGRGSRTPSGGRGGPGAVERTAEDVIALKALSKARSAGGFLSKWGRRALGLGEAPLSAAGFAGKALPRILGAEGAIAQLVLSLGGSENQDYYKYMNIQRAQKVFQNKSITGATNMAIGTMKGHAELWLTLNIEHPNGKVERRRVHVPLDQWAHGKFPTRGGKPGSQRTR
jgi:hypothetical protein